MDRRVGSYRPLSAAVATAILIGDRSSLAPEVEDRLQRAGTYHVIAISGGNIAILAALSSVLLRVLHAGPASAACLSMIALAAYLAVVGGGASVTRATLMALVYLTARLVDQRTRSLNALAVAVSADLIMEPTVIADVGFLLTVSATSGIVLGAPLLVPTFDRWLFRDESRRAPAWLRPPITLVAATVAADLALFPVAASVFGRLTAAGVLLNLAAIPLMVVLQIAALAVVLADFVNPALAAAAGRVVDLAAVGLVESGRFVDLAPWLVRRLPSPPVAIVAVYYAGWTVWLWLRPVAGPDAGARGSNPRGPLPARLRTWVPAGRRLRRWSMALIALTGTAIVTHPAPFVAMQWLQSLVASSGAGHRTLRAVVFDIGQGDATLIRFPNGAAWLVDAGGRPAGFDLASRVLVPAIWQQHVRRLDVVVLSHGDPDHIGGARRVIEDLRPREIWEGIPVPSHPGLRELAGLARRTGVTWRSVRAGDRTTVGGASVRVLHPPPADWERPRVRNDDSIVLEVRYGDVSLVLPGDVGREVERTLVDTLGPAPLVVVKVPHHGSATSSSTGWIQAVNPALALVSAGRANPYGHPAPRVLDRYRAAGVRVLRTDRDGALIVETDGAVVHVQTMTGRRFTVPARPAGRPGQGGGPRSLRPPSQPS
jgi:competence protein ComEC